MRFPSMYCVNNYNCSLPSKLSVKQIRTRPHLSQFWSLKICQPTNFKLFANVDRRISNSKIMTGSVGQVADANAVDLCRCDLGRILSCWYNFIFSYPFFQCVVKKKHEDLSHRARNSAFLIDHAWYVHIAFGKKSISRYFFSQYKFPMPLLSWFYWFFFPAVCIWKISKHENLPWGLAWIFFHRLQSCSIVATTQRFLGSLRSHESQLHVSTLLVKSGGAVRLS